MALYPSSSPSSAPWRAAGGGEAGRAGRRRRDCAGGGEAWRAGAAGRRGGAAWRRALKGREQQEGDGREARVYVDLMVVVVCMNLKH